MASIVIDDLALLKCSICLDIFSQPKLLRCGHTFCEQCLEKLRLSSAASDDTPFVCPECRKVIDISPGEVENLPPNFTIQRLLDETKRSNSVTNARTQADGDVDSLTRLVFQLKQNEKSLEHDKSRFLVAVRREEAAIRQRGDRVKARVDEDVAKLVDELRAFRDNRVSLIGARRKRVQAEVSAASTLCAAYGDARQSGGAARDERTEHRKLSRLHAATEKLFRRRDTNDEELRTPSVVFTPTSSDGLDDANLVGRLDSVVGTETAAMLTSLANGKTVWGIAAVDSKLYVLRDRCGANYSYIDVYDADTLSRVAAPRHFRRFRGATDLAASARHACLYVGDEAERAVFKVGVHDGLREWPLLDHKPWGVSVTYRDNVLVTLYDVNVVVEIRADGEYVRQINLETAGILHAQHALHASAHRLIVCHATSRITVVDSDGTPVRRRAGGGGESAQPEHGPCYLAADPDQRVYAADVLHRRIAVYSPALEFVGEVVGREGLNWWPTRLFVDSVRRRLYVADSNFDGQKYTAGRVVVFSLR